MKQLKTRKFWFLVLCVSMSISFSSFTVFNQYFSQTQVYSENLAEKGVESDEKSNESSHSFYIHEAPTRLPITNHGNPISTLGEAKFLLPSFSPSPHTPPPDLG